MDFEEEGGLPDDFANEAAWENGRLMNKTLASLEPGNSSVSLVAKVSCQSESSQVFTYNFLQNLRSNNQQTAQSVFLRSNVTHLTGNHCCDYSGGWKVEIKMIVSSACNSRN